MPKAFDAVEKPVLCKLVRFLHTCGVYYTVWTLFCAQGYSHTGSQNGFPETKFRSMEFVQNLLLLWSMNISLY